MDSESEFSFTEWENTTTDKDAVVIYKQITQEKINTSL